MTPQEQNAYRRDMAAQFMASLLIGTHPPLADLPAAPINAEDETTDEARLREQAIAAAGQASRDWYRTMAVYAERSFAAADAFMAEAMLHTGPLDADGIPTDLAALDPLCVHKRRTSEDCPECAREMEGINASLAEERARNLGHLPEL